MGQGQERARASPLQDAHLSTERSGPGVSGPCPPSLREGHTQSPWLTPQALRWLSLTLSSIPPSFRDNTLFSGSRLFPFFPSTRRGRLATPISETGKLRPSAAGVGGLGPGWAEDPEWGGEGRAAQPASGRGGRPGVCPPRLSSPPPPRRTHPAASSRVHLPRSSPGGRASRARRPRTRPPARSPVPGVRPKRPRAAARTSAVPAGSPFAPPRRACPAPAPRHRSPQPLPRARSLAPLAAAPSSRTAAPRLTGSRRARTPGPAHGQPPPRRLRAAGPPTWDAARRPSPFRRRGSQAQPAVRWRSFPERRGAAPPRGLTEERGRARGGAVGNPAARLSPFSAPGASHTQRGSAHRPLGQGQASRPAFRALRCSSPPTHVAGTH